MLATVVADNLLRRARSATDDCSCNTEEPFDTGRSCWNAEVLCCQAMKDRKVIWQSITPKCFWWATCGRLRQILTLRQWPQVCYHGIWSQIAKRWIESPKVPNQISNRSDENRILNGQIESRETIQSRFKSNRDWDLPITGWNVSWNALNLGSHKTVGYHSATVLLQWNMDVNVLEISCRAVLKIQCLLYCPAPSLFMLPPLLAGIVIRTFVGWFVHYIGANI